MVCGHAWHKCIALPYAGSSWIAAQLQTSCTPSADAQHNTPSKSWGSIRASLQLAYACDIIPTFPASVLAAMQRICGTCLLASASVHVKLVDVQEECRVLLDGSTLEGNYAVNGGALFAGLTPCFMVHMLA